MDEVRHHSPTRHFIIATLNGVDDDKARDHRIAAFYTMTVAG
jgi:hypothetical protein